jgi:hypothetical protein
VKIFTCCEPPEQKQEYAGDGLHFSFSMHTTQNILMAVCKRHSFNWLGTRRVASENVVIILVIKTMMMIARAKEHKRETGSGEFWPLLADGETI